MPERVFCDRPVEMEQLQRAYERCSDGHRMQVVSIVGNSGLGKTRLVTEFYRWLSKTYDDGLNGYWPADLSADGYSLELNPHPSSCRRAASPPFFWTGMRLPDPSGSHRSLGSVVPYGAASFGAHLSELYACDRSQKHMSTIKAVINDVGADFAAERIVELAAELIPVPGFSILMSVSRAVYKAAKERDNHDVIGKLAPDQRFDRSQDVVADGWLETLSALYSIKQQHVQAKRLGRVIARPLVLFIDDAQWADRDPALVKFLTKLLANSEWPVLVILTCWEVDWNNVTKIRGIVERNDKVQASTIKLSPHANLLPAVDAALPGLTRDQSRSLLEKAGGNPAALQILIATLLQRPRYFENRDTRQVLNAEGELALRASSAANGDIRRLAESALRDGDDELRSVLAISAWQGARFVRSLSEASATALGKELAVRRALDAAVRPYAFVEVGDDGVDAFAQRIYWELAKDSFEDLFGSADETILLNALVPTFTEIFTSREDPAVKVAACEVALHIYQSREHKGAAHMLCLAALELSNAARSRFEFAAASSYAETFYSNFKRGSINVRAFDGAQLLLLCDSLEYVAIDSAAELLDCILGLLCYAGDERLYAAALGQAARVARKSGSSFARDYARKCLESFKRLFEREKTALARRDLYVAVGLLADLENAAGCVPEARDLALQALELVRPTLESPTPDQLRDASHGYARLSRTFLHDKPDSAYRYALESIRLARANLESSNPSFAHRDLALALLCAIDAAIALRRFKEARESVTECIALLSDLHVTGSWTSRRDLALALWRSSTVNAELGDFVPARDDLTKSIDLLKQGQGSQRLADGLVALRRAKELAERCGDHAAAKAFLDEAFQVYRSLSQITPHGSLSGFDQFDNPNDQRYFVDTMSMSPSLATRWFFGIPRGINPEDT